MGPRGRGSADYRPAPSQWDFAVTARRRMEPSPATAPFLFAQISHPRPSLVWEGLISCSQALQKSTESWVQSLENSTPFFKVIAENQERALACFWRPFGGNWYFGGMAICKELTPRQAAVWNSDVLSLMEIKPCQRLSWQVKPCQKTNDQPADYYPWPCCTTSIQRFFGGLRSKPGSDKLSNSSPCTEFWKQGLGIWCTYM